MDFKIEIIEDIQDKYVIFDTHPNVNYYTVSMLLEGPSVGDFVIDLQFGINSPRFKLYMYSIEKVFDLFCCIHKYKLDHENDFESITLVINKHNNTIGAFFTQSL